ncbi:glycosyltransferase family 4 protein [Cellulomonas dongxiuzhuiae]|uniref:glycosyltransferase family 4 protein n=1 Tax=Cellulomonas dongxiuzhuiae TaxID=2819979 RepID=UPI001AB00D37|nr:glycosyltransferase family 4 protein [Cellulomonas dongxiuzhuiae]MBO3088804.1 glycosyltransferase family 4 protein [Cellulomonas dongxiuzhuiae]
MLAQRWRRAAETAKSPAARVFFHLRMLIAHKRERRAFAAVDTVVAFSEKDKGLALDICASADVTVVRPPLEDPEAPRDTEALSELLAFRSSRPEKVVLFTAALSRPENDQAALHLVEEIWPRIAREACNARLVIAGSSPSEKLKHRVATTENASLTGYVQSFAESYRQASVVVVPLKRGAGVKFKTVEALLWGIPVVTSPVGAEGIGRSALFYRVTDDPVAFAEGVVELIVKPAPRAQLVEPSWRWAREAYSAEQFRASVAALLSE